MHSFLRTLHAVLVACLCILILPPRPFVNPSALRSPLCADPDLYCFDEQIGGAVRPHHPPHRALKFMARCCPEALRFRLQPEHFAQRRGGGAGAAGAAGQQCRRGWVQGALNVLYKGV